MTGLCRLWHVAGHTYHSQDILMPRVCYLSGSRRLLDVYNTIQERTTQIMVNVFAPKALISCWLCAYWSKTISCVFLGNVVYFICKANIWTSVWDRGALALKMGPPARAISNFQLLCKISVTIDLDRLRQGPHGMFFFWYYLGPCRLITKSSNCTGHWHLTSWILRSCFCDVNPYSKVAKVASIHHSQQITRSGNEIHRVWDSQSTKKNSYTNMWKIFFGVLLST